MPRTLSAIAPDWWDYTTLDADAARRRRAPDARRHAAALAGRASASCSTTRSRSSISPKRSNTSPPGSRRRRTTRSASAGRSARPSNCRWWRGSSTSWGCRCSHAHFWGMDEWVVDGTRGAGHASAVVRAGRPGAVLQPHPPRAAHARRQPALPEGRHRPPTARAGTRRALRGDAGRPGRRQALGLQRSAAARRANTWTRRRRRRSIAQLADARGGPASDDASPRTRAPAAAATSALVPTQALTVGPVETWKAEKVSIWHAGMHDNPFGQRLTTLMICKASARQRPCRCRCWPIIRTCSSTSTAAASARARSRCTEVDAAFDRCVCGG